MTAPALFLGIQEGYRHLPSIELYVLVSPVGDHPAGSAVSRQTLENLGYSVIPHRSNRDKEAA